MPHRTHGRVSRQINSARQRLASEAGLPFSQFLDGDLVQQALAEDDISFRERLYPPCTTLWIFLSQVLDPMQCCLQAVLRFLAHRLAQGLTPCSSETGAYCQARLRLPEGVVKRLMMATGQQLHRREMPDAWRWKGRSVKLADGTIVSMPDTPENQQEYPQSRRQQPGVGFPAARMVVLFSLAVGTVLAAAIAACRGKETGEASLLRSLNDNFEPGDVLLGDRIFAPISTSSCCKKARSMPWCASIRPAVLTFGAASAWDATITWSLGPNPPRDRNGWTKKPINAFPTK